MTTFIHQPNNDASDKDLELLSAYLDNELTAAERARLEERLQHDPALQAELQTLRETVMLLRDMPTVTPPRSFTLDPANLPARRSSLLDWIGSLDAGGLISLQGAGVVAVLVLALGISGVLALNAGMGQQAASISDNYEAAPATAPAAAATLPTEPPRPAMESAAEADEAADGAATMADEAAEESAGVGLADEVPTAAGTPPPPAAPAMLPAPTGTAPPEADTSQTNTTPRQQATPSVIADSHDTSSPDTRDLATRQQPDPAERSGGGTAPVGLILAGGALVVLVLALTLWFWRRRASQEG